MKQFSQESYKKLRLKDTKWWRCLKLTQRDVPFDKRKSNKLYLVVQSIGVELMMRGI